MSDKYTDILIHVLPRDNSSQPYPVRAELSDGSRFAGGELCLDHTALREAENDPEKYGLMLFDALFSGSIHTAYAKAMRDVETRASAGLRVRLWIDHGAAELHALAWERLHHVRQGRASPMLVWAGVLFSRYVGLELPESTDTVKLPLRMLFAVSNPSDLERYSLHPLDVDAEITNLLGALGELRGSRRLEVTLMPGRTPLSNEPGKQWEGKGYKIERIEQGIETNLGNITRLLTRDRGYHILHFLGHGRLSRRDNTVALFLEDRDGRVDVVKSDDLVMQIGSVNPQPYLMFLAACETAKRAPEDGNPFIGLAPKLVRAGIPAVVAMQDQISTVTAQSLTSDFYSYLLEHGIVDLAMNQARLLLFKRQETGWAVPVLFMRMRDGRLFVPQTSVPDATTSAQRETLERALAMARRTLAILEEQAAGFGKLHTPVHLRIELEEKRREVAELEARLKT